MSESYLKKSVVILGFLVLCATVLSLPAKVQAQPASRSVVLVDCDYLEINEISATELPHLYSFLSKGGIALLNTNTAGLHNRPNAAVTVGAGRVSLGTDKETEVLGASETYFGQPLALFRGRTGFVPRADNLVVLDLPAILRANEVGLNKSVPGTLAESLHKKGLRTGALGNADFLGLPQRSVAVIAMDSRGIIDAGDVSGQLLLADQVYPTGSKTNYPALEKSFLNLRNNAQFIVIDLGDLVRLEQSKPYLTDKIYERERKQILQEYDQFLSWLLNNVDVNNSRVIVSSLVPSPQDLEHKRTMGWLAAQEGNKLPGLLISPTTRRPGVITDYDLAPSIAAYLNAPVDKNWLGRAWQVVPDQNNVQHLQDQAEHIFFTAMMRPPLVEGYVVLHLVVLGIIILCLCFRPRYAKYLTPLLLGLLAIPLTWLLIGKLPILSPWLYVAVFLGSTSIIVLLSMLLARDNLDAILLLCMATVLLLLGDSMTGCALQKSALLGYDPMDGARFYGIGNEYMGVLLGSIIMGSALFIQRIKKHTRSALVIVGALFLLTVVILGTPQWGSKFGGVLTTLVAFIYTFARFNRIHIRGRHVLAASILVILIGTAVLFRDFMRPPELRSHFGLLITSIQSRGMVALQEIFSRKLAMNYRLIKYTIWTRVYLGSLIALGILFYRPVGILGNVLKKYPAVAAGLEGSLVAALAALVFNDSGIVAASTAIIFPAATLFYLAMKEREVHV